LKLLHGSDCCNASRRRAAQHASERGDDGGLRAANIRHRLIILPTAAEALVERHESERLLPTTGGELVLLLHEELLGEQHRREVDGPLAVLAADEIDTTKLGKAFVIYQGHHGDAGAHRADVILPGAAYTEKSGIYVNTEGRAQIANRAAFPPGEAREDWAIIRALSDVLGKKLPYDSLLALRQAISKAVPHLMRIDQIEAGKASDVKALAGKKGGKVDKTPFKSSVEDFYLTNPIARASAVMAECSRLASGKMLTAAE